MRCRSGGSWKRSGHTSNIGHITDGDRSKTQNCNDRLPERGGTIALSGFIRRIPRDLLIDFTRQMVGNRVVWAARFLVDGTPRPSTHPSHGPQRVSRIARRSLLKISNGSGVKEQHPTGPEPGNPMTADATAALPDTRKLRANSRKTIKIAVQYLPRVNVVRITGTETASSL